MNTESENNKENRDNWTTVSYLHNGKPEQVAVELPTDADSESTEEAAQFVQTLEDNRQIQHGPGPLGFGQTHQIVTDEHGNRLLLRVRYS